MTGQPYTGSETKILLSFAMVDHGGTFAHWLRDKLMKRLNYFSPNAVYMDCIASRGRTTRHYGYKIDDEGNKKSDAPTFFRIPWWTYVTPDTRDRFDPQGYMPIGAGNSQWNKMYVKAMSQAAGMIMVLTADYMRSEWCMKEWGQFHDENQKRNKNGKPPLRGVALTFPSEGSSPVTNGMPANGFSGIEQIPVTKVYGLGGILWHKADFGIGDDALNRVVGALGL